MKNKNNIPEYKVSEFNESFKELIESKFNYLRIKGEVSEIKTATKGQLYLVLKDEDSILSGVIWQSKKNYLNIQPELGMEVIATGKITTWSRYKTTYQIDIDNIEISGEGALLKIIEERKKRLQKKGIFDSKFKKKLPYLPGIIGVITSPTGSVIYDIINTLKERFPVSVDLWPVSVQGSNAALSIISAIKGFNEISYENKPDVIIIARGGGSTEDLMAFNNEELIMEVFKSKIPIISAIGHETDNTLIDLVSDSRSSTPTAAAERVVPNKDELTKRLDNLIYNLNSYIENFINFKKDMLLNLSKFLKLPDNLINSYKTRFLTLFNSFINQTDNVLKSKSINLNQLSRFIKLPTKLFKDKKNNLNSLNNNLNYNINNKIENYINHFNDLIKILESNSINNNLKKGYSIVSKSNKIVKKSSIIKNNDTIKVKFYDKSININVKKIN
ncbi:MAG: Exodeoxyribonuclease 7 large subunit [Alphaproteobacteria bacterium MarineAlpha5_Bin8]|nr:MAG: Exodeoxyribonuclease 7 large subunit [Alphaproteobacteria bacterium MarineAlpha5_Bin7]PPR46885.1 MAG: Exodeoxyribonuclease 7 large subunit [Alphaproteobacteria bacterium MarineAlpha5_Bin8]PPR54670.1 MAG: Exodeoxyribonuclease 7 large subunit [Alphaproteobacteria bacterium MarineAlpha5_Bin6]|tara:strand:+ start:1159 stop:2493 length:1335 start_codon:yes stop_codon:yes gene_type:complete